MNDTPITNKHKQYINGFAGEFVPAYVCEELERKGILFKTALEDATKSLNTISTWPHGDFDFFSVRGYANSRMTAAKEAAEKIEDGKT